jgi:DNA-binding NtrC family response regulator
MNKKTTILITDDEQDILDSLEFDLAEIDNNIEIIKATSGRIALRCIQENSVDLLLTDIAMPDMNGFELYKRTKYMRPNMPIIMMTGFGYDPNHTLLNAKKMGLGHIFYKPFDVKKLLKTIYEVLEKQSSEVD